MTTSGDKATTVEGILLSTDYVTIGNEATIRLWITTPQGARVVHAPGFEPYFYAVPHQGHDPEDVCKSIERIEAGGASPKRVETVTRTENLENVTVLKITTKHPQEVPKLRTAIARHESIQSTREDDVLFANRYLIDHEITPLTWTTVQTEPSPTQPGEHNAQEITQNPEEDIDLHILAFDLEVYNPHVTPNPETDPIVVATLADNHGNEEILTKGDDEDDRKLVATLAKRIRDLDPDVITTYNGDKFDWPYLVDRAKHHGFDLRVGRDGSPPQIRQAGRTNAVRITGRANMDGYRMAQRDLPNVKVKTLERVAEHLGIDVDTFDLEAQNMAQIWDDPTRREELLAYAINDAKSALGITQNLLGLQIGLCQRTYQDLTDGSRMGRGRQADWYLLGEAHKRGIIAPDKNQHHGSTQYEGGVVLEPPAGIHEDVVYLDFSSMYPSIMVAYNVSPDTYIPPDETTPADVHTAPDVGHRFRTEPDGFFKRLLQELIDQRTDLKQRMHELDPASQAYKNLKVEEQAIKVLTNAFYGYMGWTGARWQSVPCAEATTAWGRHFIQRVLDMARDHDLNVLYGDTDSIMVLDGPTVPSFTKSVNEDLPIELEVEATFETLFFTGAKKRYAGRTTDGATIIRGLEVRRGDWCSYAKDTQRRIIETLLTKQDPEEATRMAQEAIEDLREGRVPLDALLIHKTLNRDPDDYEGKQPHALAVEKAMEREPGFQAPVGTKVGYVIVEDSSDLISDRARLVDFMTDNETVDSAYYIENQVLPAALRVLAYFGVDADELKGRPSQASLEDWF